MGEIEQLVRRAKKRDPDAFTELMQLHEKDMYRTASAILPQDADIADGSFEVLYVFEDKQGFQDTQGKSISYRGLSCLYSM